MRVRLVCNTGELDWILGKIAKKLMGELEPLVQEVSLKPEPDPRADINHYVWYSDFRADNQPATIGITHIDSFRKFELVQRQLDLALAAICLSRRHMEDLIQIGLSANKLCYVNPAHDGIITPKKIHIGITTRAYLVDADPCKREWMLEQLADFINPNDFVFSIMGSGWDAIVQALRRRGFEVTYYPHFNLERYRTIVPTFDYYLYLGWDEGSMGLLDALHAGVKTIATPQGFHLDIKGGLTYYFDDFESLRSVFGRIAKEKNDLTDSVRGLTWSHYARKHLEIWEYLLTGRLNTGRSPYTDGLNSLLESKPPKDLIRAQLFQAELEQIGKMREDLQRQSVVTTTGRQRVKAGWLSRPRYLLRRLLLQPRRS
jgi:hypothetical protein